jgi:general secretion pathway protein J
MSAPPRALRRRRGFTLIELLVAITVLALVSLIAWRGLDSLVHTRERLQPEADDVRALLVAFGQIERDLAQVVNPAFVPTGVSPLVARSESPAGFEVLRMAPAAEGGSAVQAVIYELRDGRLMRLSSAPMFTIGAPRTSVLTETPLLTGVQALRLRLWQPGRGWAPPEAAVMPNPMQPAAGVEVDVELDDGRRYRRVLLVGQG